jgi:hypothetical protein
MPKKSSTQLRPRLVPLSWSGCIVMPNLFSAHVDTMEQTASESTLQETSICTRMVTRSQSTHQSKHPVVVPVHKPRLTRVARAQR